LILLLNPGESQRFSFMNGSLIAPTRLRVYRQTFIHTYAKVASASLYDSRPPAHENWRHLIARFGV
jgi:hypothetical protein